MILDRRFILGSLCAHIIVLSVSIVISDWHGSHQSFLVLGAHSRITTHAYFSMPKPIVRMQQSKVLTPHKKSAPVKKMQAQKPVPKKVESKKSVPPKKVQAQQKNVAPKKAPSKTQMPRQAIGQNVNVGASGSDAVDAKTEKSFQAIQEAVDKAWRPPLGVAKGTECSLHLKLDMQGMVKEFELIKKSPVWIFNSSVLQAARKLVFDREFGGMSFVIHFRQ